MTEKLPEAIDLSHHLSRVSRARTTSPLKGLQKYFGKEGMISLAGGLPHPDYFPFSTISAEALPYDSYVSAMSNQSRGSFSWLWSFLSGGKKETVPITIPKYPANSGDISLSTALQYSMAAGIPQLQRIMKEFTDKVYKPAYSNYATIVHTGNTDGWVKASMTLCNPGEGVLVSEWTYPSALSTIIPLGLKPVPVAMDYQGMKSDSLRIVLSSWDETTCGMPRPHVMYTVPIGQNPTGATMEAVRKKEIYDICVEYDIIIVEDDPYYFLQEGPYDLPALRNKKPFKVDEDDELFISHLAPSYLKFDYQGRVIRLDTFSKTIAPGCRMGWFTCNPLFAERFERQAETTTQAPCGFSQSIVTSLLLNWRYEGYLRWLKGLRVQYTERRNFFIDCLAEEFHLQRTLDTQGVWAGCEVYHASQKHRAEKQATNEKRAEIGNAVFSFVPPTSGMFVWLKLQLDGHPFFNTVGYKELEMKLWTEIAEAGVLFGPGFMFSSNQRPDEGGSGHFRISFSNAEFGDMKKAVSIFATVLEKFFEHV
ncbi:PLP-dependent transferase [Crucibulum laeve]|uniref:PLP-dependent transferase n=1 Tax=Crucibulum laeve TaxID=68775 RepID=A0A5C3MFY6_9AGAR|nr:PLP-dependent transferase [Crucibulum laeve]